MLWVTSFTMLWVRQLAGPVTNIEISPTSEYVKNVFVHSSHMYYRVVQTGCVRRHYDHFTQNNQFS